MGWKTITGVLSWAFGTLASPDIAGILPDAVATVVQVGGAVLGTVGVRHAIYKTERSVFSR